MHVLFVLAQTLQDGRTLYSKKIPCFLSVFDFNGFWRERRHKIDWRENVVTVVTLLRVLEKRYQMLTMLEVFSFCDRERVCNLLH